MSAVIAPIVTGPPSWATDGVCATYGQPDLWFPVSKPEERKAKALCMTCPLLRTCGRYADENDVRWGVWGAVLRGDKRGGAL